MSTPRAFLSGDGDRNRSLVVIFLRGAADGLNLVPPLADDAYFRARATLAVTKSAALALDGFFGLHPRLAALKPLYDEGALAIVHAAGSEETSRSHFEAQDFVEHGGIAAGGWLGRFLRYRDEPASGALSAIAVGKAMPESLRGAPAATVMQSLDDFTLGSGSEALLAQIERLYALERGDLAGAARDTLGALRRIEDLRGASYRPENGASYPDDDFGHGLLQIARLVKARVGLETATLDLRGWDSHFAQTALITPLMSKLAEGLAAFHRDLGKAMEHTTVVVMTEFGRRVQENASLGTDHGRGSVMFVLGGGVHGGRVLARWPGLQADVLEGPGDVPVVHNYRNVLAPILRRHGAGENLRRIFPDFEIEPLGLFE